MCYDLIYYVHHTIISNEFKTIPFFYLFQSMVFISLPSQGVVQFGSSQQVKYWFVT